MPRQRHWSVEGIEVTRADVRRWMASVGARCPDAYYWGYVRDYAVIRKIARAKADGQLERIIATEAARMGVDAPRAARAPSVLQRLRRAWPEAANDPEVDIAIAADEIQDPAASLPTM